MDPNNNVSDKQKNPRLSLQQKVAVLKKVDDGVPICAIAKEFSITRAAVRYIKKNRSAILGFVDSGVENENQTKKRKSTKMSKDNILDDVIYTWFSEARESNIPISGPIICEKALIANKKLGGDSNFTASNGWLHRFKQRHGIKCLSMQGEKLAADHNAAQVFQQEFPNFVCDGGYKLENIYNADESGLNWRNLPRKTLVSATERECPGDKVRKERITVMVCANASGSHRLPLLIIGKSKNPRSFKNAVLPVIYKSQSSAWMDRSLFLDWYKNNFIPSVKARQMSDGVLGKVVLLMDNAPSHPSADILNAVDENFLVKYFPANTTSLIQPMDQGIIEKMKRMYRKNLLSRILLSGELQNPKMFLKRYDLKDCCELVASAFNSLTPANLQAAWRKLLQNVIHISHEGDATEKIISESIDIAHKVPDFSDHSDDVLRSWFDQDAEDQGWRVQTIEEIVSEIAPRNNEVTQTMGTQNDERQLIEKENSSSGHDALTAVNTLLEWCSENPVHDTDVQDGGLSFLNDIRARIIPTSPGEAQIDPLNPDS